MSHRNTQFQTNWSERGLPGTVLNNCPQKSVCFCCVAPTSQIRFPSTRVLSPRSLHCHHELISCWVTTTERWRRTYSWSWLWTPQKEIITVDFYRQVFSRYSRMKYTVVVVWCLKRNLIRESLVYTRLSKDYQWTAESTRVEPPFDFDHSKRWARLDGSNG